MSIDLQTYFFRERKMWSLENEIALGMNLLLGDHANIHFSPARSLFLYQLKSLDALSYFSPVQVKDGAATLTGFFYEHQNPSSTEQIFLVPKALEKFVPRSWHKQIFSYENKTVEVDKTIRNKLILIVSALDEKQITLSGLDRLISQLTSDHCFSEVNVIVMPQKSLYAQDEVMAYQIELILRLKKAWPHIQVKVLNDFSSSTLTEFYFVDLNEYSFYYGYSTLTEFFLQRGAKNFICPIKTEQDPFLKIALSFYHEMHLTRIISEAQPNIENYFSVIKNSSMITEEIRNYCPQKINCNNLTISPSLADIAWQLAREI